MEVLSGPWADVALLLRQTIGQADTHMDELWPLWLFGLLLFLCVCLLLLQLIVYLSWKLRQGRDLINLSCLQSSHRALVKWIGSTHQRALEILYLQSELGCEDTGKGI